MSNQCKFKVGDKIKKISGTTFSNGEYVATVDCIQYNRVLDDRIYIYLKETGFYVPQEELCLVEPFTKSDLKDGMVVTYRESYGSNNLKRVVFKGSLYHVHEDWTSAMLHGACLHYYSDTLEFDENEDMDIMKVEYMGEVLWEREDDTKKKRIKELKDNIAKMQEELNNLL